MNDLYWVWLMSLTELTNQQRNLLIDTFKTAKGIYDAGESAYAKVKRLSPKSRKLLSEHRDLQKVEKTLDFMHRHQIDLMSLEDESFPTVLRKIYNPSVAFFAKGNLELLNRPMKIAIVGSRKATRTGLTEAKSFASQLSEAGFTIVSGLAAGIDAVSHEGALTGVGSTIAVLGTGINVCYPTGNKALYKRIVAEGGLIISEYFPDQVGKPYHFPVRNRIVTALSDGVLVVEAGEKSGALISAKHALEQGRNLYVIPKDISLDQGKGSNQLLKDGAKMVTGIDDILEDFVSLPTPKQNGETQQISFASIPEDLSPDEKNVLEWIRQGYRHVDDLMTVCDLDIGTLNGVLSMLEIDDLITVNYGNITVKNI